MNVILLVTLLIPLVGLLLVGRSQVRARWVALVATVANAVLAGILVFSYPGGGAAAAGGAESFAVTDWSWFGGGGSPIDIRFSVGLDGLSLWLYGLTALLLVVAVLISWESIRDLAPRYYRLLLLLEVGLLGVFTARDIILFYVFFEFTLIPLYFIIGIWGSEQRQWAAIKFFLFTLAGSLLTFLGLLSLVLWDYYHGHGRAMTFSIPELTEHLRQTPLDMQVQIWVFLALAAGFAVKVPMFPFHTWLPLAHVQAPAAGSVILAGLLLKIGTYGFLRFNLAMLPAASAACMPWIMGLAVVGVIYGALVALAQADMKRLIAYSSVSHLGYCMLGLFAIDVLGVQGGSLQMINHGLSTGALFALVGMLYDRYHTRQIADFGGLAGRLPVFAFFFVFFTLSSIGLPGLNNFAGEILLLLGTFQRAWAAPPANWLHAGLIVAVLAVFGVILGAWYMLQLVQRICFGPLREPHHDPAAGPVRDLCGREVAALLPLVVFVVWIGVHPGFFLSRMAPTVDRLITPARLAVEAQAAAAQGLSLSTAGRDGAKPASDGPTAAAAHDGGGPSRAVKSTGKAGRKPRGEADA